MPQHACRQSAHGSCLVSPQRCSQACRAPQDLQPVPPSSQPARRGARTGRQLWPCGMPRSRVPQAALHAHGTHAAWQPESGADATQPRRTLTSVGQANPSRDRRWQAHARARWPPQPAGMRRWRTRWARSARRPRWPTRNAPRWAPRLRACTARARPRATTPRGGTSWTDRAECMVPHAGCEVGWRPRRRSLEHRCVAAFAGASSFAAACHAQVAGPGKLRHVLTRSQGVLPW